MCAPPSWLRVCVPARATIVAQWARWMCMSLLAGVTVGAADRAGVTCPGGRVRNHTSVRARISSPRCRTTAFPAERLPSRSSDFHRRAGHERGHEHSSYITLLDLAHIKAAIDLILAHMPRHAGRSAMEVEYMKCIHFEARELQQRGFELHEVGGAEARLRWAAARARRLDDRRPARPHPRPLAVRAFRPRPPRPRRRRCIHRPALPPALAARREHQLGRRDPLPRAAKCGRRHRQRRRGRPVRRRLLGLRPERRLTSRRPEVRPWYAAAPPLPRDKRSLLATPFRSAHSCS